MEKEEARRLVRQAVHRLTPAERRAASERICRALLDLPELRAAATIMAYLPMPDELDTRPFVRALLATGRRLYLPRTETGARRMYPVRLISLERLRKGDYGILEPDDDETCSPADLDFVLVPGRAFDRSGHRLGRGAGYYDRFMSDPTFHAVRCGAAFACQVLEEVPHAPHDLPVDLLVTECGTLRFRSAG